jgi:putative membrane protein
MNKVKVHSVRLLLYVGILLGSALMLGVALRVDFAALGHLWGMAGWSLLWLVPYRGVYFLLFALGWWQLLKTFPQANRLSIAYLWWISSVREAIDRLLPVASVGGGVAGARLVSWRGIAVIQAGASVIVEVILTLASSYLFAVLGVVLMMGVATLTAPQRQVLMAVAWTLPVPLACFVLLRYGGWFARLERILGALVGLDAGADRGAALDREIRAALRRLSSLLTAGVLQLAALMSASLEIWFVLRLFGHPIDLISAVVLESATQAVRHAAFFIPGGLGAQEAGFVLFGQLFGIDPELALAVSLAKRLREILCGLPALLSWQWAELRRLRRPSRITCG